MSRTDKWEHTTDGWHICNRIDRQARPAGRMIGLVEAELAADDEATLVAFLEVAALEAQWALGEAEEAHRFDDRLAGWS